MWTGRDVNNDTKPPDEELRSYRLIRLFIPINLNIASYVTLSFFELNRLCTIWNGARHHHRRRLLEVIKCYNYLVQYYSAMFLF